MAGVLVRIIPKRIFDFGNLVVGSTQTLTVAERIDISQYIDCMLAVRTHASNLAGGTIKFDVFGDGFTDEDPGLPFRTSSVLFSSIAVAAFGTFNLVTYGGTVRGTYAALHVSGTRSSSNPLSATVSIDVILRSPDDSPTAASKAARSG